MLLVVGSQRHPAPKTDSEALICELPLEVVDEEVSVVAAAGFCCPDAGWGEAGAAPPLGELSVAIAEESKAKQHVKIVDHSMTVCT